jgi:hypothetical protein
MSYWNKVMFVGAAVCLLLADTACTEASYVVGWKNQMGTAEADYPYNVAADSNGHIYMAGVTGGGLDGPSLGGADAFLARFAPDGSHVWTRQLGTPSKDVAYTMDVAPDGGGDAYIAGSTNGSLNGPNAGGRDIFVSKYNAAGSLLWTAQDGTSRDERAVDCAVDNSGNVFVTGYTEGDLEGVNAGGEDMFLQKYAPNGSLLWTVQTGTSGDDTAIGCAVDSSGNVLLTGRTQRALGGPSLGSVDAFVLKYDTDGNEIWTTHVGGSGQDWGYGIATDGSGNVYVGGGTTGNIAGSHGQDDAFLCKLSNADGSLIWSRQLGTSSNDWGYDVAVDRDGNVFIGGGFRHNHFAVPRLGDVFVAKYTAAGLKQWTAEFDASYYDYLWGLTTDGNGNVIAGGMTNGPLGGPHAGGADAFIFQLNVPEPATLSLLAPGGLTLIRRRRVK